MSDGQPGCLYFIPTPIGNREDITLRALRLLREADLIACEDTRHTQRLLDYYAISKPLLSYHKFNEKSRQEEIGERVLAGEKVCLVSDAGMPAISDPGRLLVQYAAENGIPFTVLPGPSASVTAYVASGLGDGRFLFQGFLPRKEKEREVILKEIDRLPVTAILYESPQRIRRTLEELGKRWPDRDFVICREWTKLYEERRAFKGREAGGLPLEERGEYVLLVGPARREPAAWTEEQAVSRLNELLGSGLSRKDAVKELAEESGWPRNRLYDLSLRS